MVLVPLVTRILLIGGGLLLPAFRAFQYLKARHSPVSVGLGRSDNIQVGTDDTAHGHRMLQHFAVMSVVVSCEWVADWLLFWLPFYYELKLLFVAWLVLPMTQGSLMFYQATLDPILREHEQTIDGTVSSVTVTIQSRVSNSFVATAHTLRSLLTAWAASILHLIVAQQQQPNQLQSHSTFVGAPGQTFTQSGPPAHAQQPDNYYGQALSSIFSSVTSAVAHGFSRAASFQTGTSGQEQHAASNMMDIDTCPSLATTATICPQPTTAAISESLPSSSQTIRASAYPAIAVQPTPPAAALSSPVQAVINRRRARRSVLPSPAASVASSPPSSTMSFPLTQASSSPSPSSETLSEPQSLMCSPMDDDVYKQ